MIVIANVLQPLIDICQVVLDFWYDAVGDWGLAIILLTFTVRLVILPLTFRQVRSMQELQRLQPEIKRMQERYKDDKQRMQQEMMRFYQEHGVNPLASCFPLLLQLPFFIGLFYLLKDNPDLEGQSFLFYNDLSASITGEPVVLAVSIVLYVATQLGATMVTAFSADPTQRRIMLALPFVFVIFIINFPAGLIVYWITTNVWTIGQQLLVKKLFPKPEPIKVEDDGKEPAEPAGPPPEPKGLFGRLTQRAMQAQEAQAGNGRGGGGKAKAGTASRSQGTTRSGKAPPPPPRKKKKRSGRRR